MSALTERDHFQRLKPCVLLSSSHKDFVWIQKTWNATRLVCNVFYTACLWSVFAINTCDCTYLCLLRVLYCSEVGRFRVRVGLGASMKVKILYNYFYFLQMHANH